LSRHPRLNGITKDVDGRDKPGHDEEEAAVALDRVLG
jgi:hypothetical protein